MLQSIKKILDFRTSGVINLLLWSLLFTLYLLYDKYDGSLNNGLVMMYVYLLVSIIILNCIFFIVLRFIFSFYHHGRAVSYLAANLAVTFTFIVNNTTVLVYGKQLGYEGLVMGIRGWQGGEMGDFTFTVLKALLFIGVYLLLFYLTYLFFSRIISWRNISIKISILAFCTIILTFLIIHFRLIAMASIDQNMNDMKHKIPWQDFTGFTGEMISAGKNGEKTRPIPPLFEKPPLLDEKTEFEQLRKLNLAGEKILLSDIKVKTPYNILFMNIEGLRHDMLNPENMPFLYRFASEKGFILKKHYTTGNNTPGALYGMLTGLAPYYYEPLRSKGFLNMSLHALKKAGYTQSFYYNSPKDYEYIHRDIIEKTESRFCQIPGVKEDYAPREKKLIEMLLSDLKNDKGSRRFDYYLMNVSHFNYYYPEECRKYTPDYKANFTIISGSQEKFKKDGAELKNRYMNSVLYTDRLLEQLLSGMEKTGRLENTIIVISGDHGEEFWEHGSFGHTWGLNNIQIQPAALIYYPGIKRNSITYRYSSHQDFMPTVFDLIGLNADWRAFTTGKSLITYEPGRDFAISSLGILVSFKRNGYAVIGNGYKILYRNNMDLNQSPYALYDDADKPVENFVPGRVKDLLLKTTEAKRLKVPEF